MPGNLITLLFTAIIVCGLPDGSKARSRRYASESTKEHEGCVKLMEKVYKQETIAPDPPHIVGEWVSRRCEVRSGPEFLLRKYKFTAEGKFDVHQFYYADSSCRKPAYLLVARGTYKIGRGSFLTPGARDMEYNLATVTVMPYTDNAAEMLSKAVNASDCDRPIKASHSWKPYQRYEIYSYLEVDKRALPADVALRSAVRDFDDVVLFDVDCTDALDFALHELQLVRLEMSTPSARQSLHQQQQQQQQQQHQHHHHQQMQTSQQRLRHGTPSTVSSTYAMGDDETKLLFLGDVHTDRKQRNLYRPSGFQEPLAAIRAAHCPVCRLLAEADDYYPAMLVPTTTIEPGLALQGEWFSERCEVLPSSMPTTRHVQFANDNRTWEAYQHYFADPSCRDLMFTVYARGYLVFGHPVGDLRGTRAIDMFLNYAKLTAHDERMLSVLSGQNPSTVDSPCGVKPWKIGYEQDVTMTGGCAVLGLRVPQTERQIVRVEWHERETLLFMGQAPTPSSQTTFTLRATSIDEDSRPTSFALPLVKCTHLSDASVPSSHPNHYSFYRSTGVSYLSSPHNALSVFTLLLLPLMLSCVSGLLLPALV